MFLQKLQLPFIPLCAAAEYYGRSYYPERSNQDASMVMKQIVGILVGLTAVVILSLVDYHRVVSFAPVIFLLSDGSPNDDWKKGLDTLKQNKWFQHGLKIALGIGSKVNMDVLRALPGMMNLQFRQRMQISLEN